MNSKLILKRIAGIVFGSLIGILVIAAMEYAGGKMFPHPQNLNFNDPKVLETLMENTPVEALMLILMGWYLGALTGAASVRYLLKEQSFWPSLAVGLLLNGFAIINMLMIPHPYWFLGAAMCVFVPGALAG